MDFPKGTIVAWSPDRDSIVEEGGGRRILVPNGWVLCDGRNDTPNLSDKFIFGTCEPTQLLSNGGNADHYHESVSIPNSMGNINGGSAHYAAGHGDDPRSAGLPHGHSGGSTATASNIPPYVKLMYIMKI